ncbi:hypothetical protein [Enterobacillus tribolii]|uniref:Uncharacterized protein n=1 Tax=Enterobacillus tribolii TaxID=1487935 RepID=A0A370QGF3_9GAMM|nr:hypothetical protein [Enterobacillus tribolii]MBW7981759.1 hypothetical protein [Enterobacillus tribolii]RDK87442.1 hypothetical protein C8D90_10937 [Enterobacillus tribolii]
MNKAFSAWVLGIALVAPAVAAAADAPDAAQARGIIAQELEQDLLCVRPGEHARANAHRENNVLKAAGARITFDDAEDTYNNYIYRFEKPLMVKGLPVYSVSQTEGENGVIITAEVKGNPAALARELGAKPLGKNEIVFGLGNELYQRAVSGVAGKADAIIIGADDDQKAIGRFYFGCSQGAES